MGTKQPPIYIKWLQTRVCCCFEADWFIGLSPLTKLLILEAAEGFWVKNLCKIATTKLMEIFSWLCNELTVRVKRSLQGAHSRLCGKYWLDPHFVNQSQLWYLYYKLHFLLDGRAFYTVDAAYEFLLSLTFLYRVFCVF